MATIFASEESDREPDSVADDHATSVKKWTSKWRELQNQSRRNKESFMNELLHVCQLVSSNCKFLGLMHICCNEGRKK